MIGIMQGRLTSSDKLDFFPFSNWEEEFSIAREIGFDAIEWGFAVNNWEKNPLLLKSGVKRIRNLVQKTGVKVISVCGYYFAEYGFVGNSAQGSVGLLKRLIEQSSKIGIKRIVIPFLGKNEINSANKRLRAAKNIELCLETAQRYKMKLVLETSLPAEELKTFVEKFQSPFVGVCYDTGNCTALFGEKAPKDVGVLGELITSVHIKDRCFKDKKTYILGLGGTDFKKIFRSLKKIGFCGPFILEAARSPIIDNRSLNKYYLDFIKDIWKEVEN